MKTREQEMFLLGLQEMNGSEKNEVEGGIRVVPDGAIYCCIDIPPMLSYATIN